MSEFRRRLMMQGKADNPILKDYLTIVALEDGLTAKLSVNTCEYCVDGDGVWKSLPVATETETINAGQTLSFRGNLTPTSNNGIGTFTVNKFHNLKGNCMSLLFGDDAKDCFSLAGKNYAFCNLFRGNDKVIYAKELKLPASTLEYRCYYTMFANCTSLLSAPELPATTLATYCYYGLFYGCTSLTEAPELPATTLASDCYYVMFANCISLKKAPELPSTTLITRCYGYMFDGCNNLCYIKMKATAVISNNHISGWVRNVALSGTFVKASGVEIPIGTNGIPRGWTVIEE